MIDALLKVNTPNGPAWHRYNDDGYGEHEDGSPFDGTGVGRAWPLMTGERAHYELAAGRKKSAVSLLHAMEAFAGDGGLISEQIWDSEDIPELELFCGRPSGSAMPLVWAHAEYVKLRRSLQDGHVYDMPPQTVERYIKNRSDTPFAIWRFNQKTTRMPAGKKLRIEVQAPSVIHWSIDGWEDAKDTTSHDTGLGMYLVDLPTEKMKSGEKVSFTFYWLDSEQWEGTNFQVEVQ